MKNELSRLICKAIFYFNKVCSCKILTCVHCEVLPPWPRNSLPWVLICDCILENQPFTHKNWNTSLPVHDRHTHALSRNTKHWTIESQVCFYTRLFINAVKPRGCISWHWGASIGLHGVPGCSSHKSWPPLCIVTVCATDWRYSTALWVWMVALARLRLPTRPCLPPPPPAHPPPINSIRDITGVGKKRLKNQQHLDSL